jgi:hypothetical protein
MNLNRTWATLRDTSLKRRRGAKRPGGVAELDSLDIDTPLVAAGLRAIGAKGA